jgi:hypothetical protein
MMTRSVQTDAFHLLAARRVRLHSSPLQHALKMAKPRTPTHLPAAATTLHGSCLMTNSLHSCSHRAGEEAMTMNWRGSRDVMYSTTVRGKLALSGTRLLAQTKTNEMKSYMDWRNLLTWRRQFVSLSVDLDTTCLLQLDSSA